MSIEQQLSDLKEAIQKNTAALLALGPGASQPAASKETTKKETTKKETSEKKPEVTQEQMQAALIKIKDDFGMDKAKEVIKEFGGVERMGDIKPAKYAAVFEAAVAKHAALSNTGEEESSGDL